MEAEAVKLGIHFAQSAGYSPLILESDSQEVVGLIQNKKGSKTEIFWTVSTIQDNLARMSQSRIQHVRRECNTIAHALAVDKRSSCIFDHQVLWQGSFPLHIMSLFSL